MIKPSPMFQLMIDKDIPVGRIAIKLGVPRNILQKILDCDGSVTLTSIDKACRCLKCQPSDLVEFDYD